MEGLRMIRPRSLLTIATLCLLQLPLLSGLATAKPAVAPKPAKKPATAAQSKTRPSSDFIRVVRGKDGPHSMELAVLSFRSPDGALVDLVGAVHIADQNYYKALNSQFKSYQAVLYELVAESDGVMRPIPVAGMEPDNALSSMQVGMRKMLGLHFQLDDIDYNPPNFVHADISPSEFQKSMTKRGETFQQAFLRIIKSSMADESSIDPADLDELDLMGLIFSGPTPRDQVVLRRILASSFEDLDKLNSALGGDQGSTLINVRNLKAISVMQQQIKAGKRKIAIFYGVAHLPDMAAQLEKKRGFRYLATRWLPAWNLRLPPKSKAVPAPTTKKSSR
jgi:hypothetical protein